MAATFLSTANTFLSSSSSLNPQNENVNRPCTKKPVLTCCCSSPSSSSSSSSPVVVLSKRGICIAFILSMTAAGNSGKSGWSKANAAILEADEDDELMDKIKKDRKKRIDKQVLISSSKKETGYLQEVVYKLSKVGQAIDNNDLATANSVLGANKDLDWVKKANLAFTKLSSDPEEKDEVDAFNSSLATLILSVTKNDIESSKLALVSSATALEKWTALTGLVSQLKGL